MTLLCISPREEQGVTRFVENTLKHEGQVVLTDVQAGGVAYF